MRPFPSDLFASCLEVLARPDPPGPSALEPARCFLTDLGYLDARGALQRPDLVEFRSKLLALASRLELFPLPVPDAPRALLVGGNVEPARVDSGLAHRASSASGLGLSLSAAFEACVGEAAEYLSQLEQGDEHIERTSWSHRHLGLVEPTPLNWREFQQGEDAAATPADWLQGTNLFTGDKRLVPADICIRRRRVTPQPGLSSGCAAGLSTSDATRRALLEVLERDAAALWWVGGRVPRRVALEAAVSAGVAQLYQQAGRDPSSRHSALLDITTDLGIPCCAAVSANSGDGLNFACGLAARVDWHEAIRAAVLEMFQMEAGYHVLAAKRARIADSELNEHDTSQLARGEHLGGLWATQLLLPTDPSPWPESRAHDPRDELVTILDTLHDRGYSAYCVDLQRGRFAVPVVKVLVPGTQPYPSPHESQRLTEIIRSTGGGARSHRGVPLL